MEVLAGARDESHLDQLRRLLARTATLSTGPGDYEAAALLYRQCRRLGLSIRSLLDCLVAAIALREGASVLHADRDFPAIAQCAPLGLYRPT
jgi:predicted nucleic acid-binding protein